MPKINKRNILRFIGYFTFTFLLFLFPSPNHYFLPVEKKEGLAMGEEYKLSLPPLIPVNSTGVLPPLDISSEGIYILDIPSNIIIYEKDSQKKLFPASTTKIITAIVAMENNSLDDIYTVKTVITEGRVMGLISGEQLTLESLLYGALVHSANDAAYAIAENHPGGVRGFVDKMNELAQKLNLTDTHFTNPIGFDDPDHYTSAESLAKFSLYALNNKTFAKIVSTKNITVSDVNYVYFHDLKNVNSLLGKIAGVAGVKTGFTENGGEILISEVKKNNRQILLVMLKSADRFGETEKMIDWVFGNFLWRNVDELVKPS